jgi:NAD(P)-dependent dehydrogenase (short-subunit alcohol dehydrogenase family)
MNSVSVDLGGKVVAVTGASGALGSAVALIPIKGRV